MEGDKPFTSESVAAFNNVPFPNRLQLCFVDLVLDDKQMATLPHQRMMKDLDTQYVGVMVIK